jgi:hypothetical protein
MKTKLPIIAAVMFFMYIIVDMLIGQYSRIVVYQPEYNHIVRIDTCRVVTDTLGKPFCIWYQDKLYLPDPYQDSDKQILNKK